jgi:glycosyltransferase involved in cell wall biosynthesis
VTQVIDPADPILGFTIRLVRALHQRVPRLVVVANEVRTVPADLGAEVRSLGKEDGRGQIAKGLRYQRILADVCRRGRPVTVVAHMCPPYLNLAAPLVKATGGRSMLWFTHPAESASLRRAERLADVVVTALPGSYPRTSAKVHPIGHSIDTDHFRPRGGPPADGTLRLVAIGRTAPTKHYPVVIEAVDRARREGVDVRLRIIGPATKPAEQAHRQEIADLIAALGLEASVTLEADVDPAAIPDLLGGGHALVNAHAHGSADKVVFEAMACARPPIVSSAVFADLLAHDGPRLTFAEADAVDLAGRIVELSRIPTGELEALGALLRSRVEAHHSLDHWADEIVRLATEAHARR